MNINERVSRIKGDKKEISLLIEEYKPFIMGVVSRKISKFVEYGVDEELSVALSAFYEAIESFDENKGAFLSFASTVIHRRLIDYLRKKRCNEVSIEECEQSNSAELTRKAFDSYSRSEYEENLRIELEMFKSELAAFNISMEKLVKASPKQRGTKKLYSTVVSYIADDSELSEQIFRKGYLPVAAVCEATGVNRKKVERGRDYIIACMIIKHGDYIYMKEYVDWEVV